jgi:hypothetical protein
MNGCVATRERDEKMKLHPKKINSSVRQATPSNICSSINSANHQIIKKLIRA